MTLKDLLRQLVLVAEQHPDCDVRFNGEPAAEWSVVLQRQIAVIGKDLVRIDPANGAASPPVLNIYVSGRQADKLSVSCPLCARAGRGR